APVRRPQAPEELAQLATVLRESGAPALTVKVVLVPVAILDLRRLRAGRRRDVLDVVAAAGHEAAHALRPQRRDDAGRAAAPVVPAEHGAPNVEGSHHLDQVSPLGAP